MNVKKAVFPVAGMGTRFLPATKASPKEMLPIVDKPLIQFAVEEVLEAGVTELIFITSGGKRTIEDHFDSNYELETKLAERQKYELLEQVQNIIPENVTCVYIRQKEALGLGHAVLCAKEVIGANPFIVSLADDLIYHPKNNCVQQMLEIFSQVHASIIAVEKVPLEHINRYGVIEFDGHLVDKVALQSIIEKPEPKQAPSEFGVTGRYIFTPEIFSCLEKIGKGSGGEIQLTDAIQQLLTQQQVYACLVSGKRYDCGSKLGYLQATVEYALRHPQIKDEFRQYLENFDE